MYKYHSYHRRLLIGCMMIYYIKSVYELYEADEINVIESIVFNGWVNSIDKVTD